MSTVPSVPSVRPYSVQITVGQDFFNSCVQLHVPRPNKRWKGLGCQEGRLLEFGFRRGKKDVRKGCVLFVETINNWVVLLEAEEEADI